MRTVLDTTVLIDHLRSVPGAVSHLDSIAEQPACSEVTRIEVLTGLRSGERSRAQALLKLVEWVPLDERIAVHAGELGRRFRASHPGLDLADLVIAATAIALGAQVATANVKHFPMFPGLEPPY